MIHEIIPNLYLGGKADALDAEAMGFRLVDIRGRIDGRDLPKKNLRSVRRIAKELHDLLKTGNNRVLVFCDGGLERSPLAVAYYLHEYHDMEVYEAYNLIREKRKGIFAREEWIWTGEEQ